MASPQEVDRAARALVREGSRVSVRRVRARLPKGGSNSTVGPLVARWKSEAGYRPNPVTADVPAALGAATDGFVRQVWAAARVEAERVVEQDRRKLALLEEECLRQLEAAWSEVDRLEEEVANLRRSRAEGVPVVPPEPDAKAVAFGAFVRLMRDRVAEREGRPAVGPRADADLEATVAGCEKAFVRPAGPRVLPRPPETTRRYWRGVILDAADLIDGSGRHSLSVEEILEGLRGTARAREPRFAKLNARLLRRKLTERSDKGKFVVKGDGDTFAARSGRPDD